MFGAQDGLLNFDVPDSVSAAALSVALGSRGSFKSLETHGLISQEQPSHGLSRSKAPAQAYQAPGQQTYAVAALRADTGPSLPRARTQGLG
jgi:hypothetical protein